MVKLVPKTKDAYMLLHEGMLAFAEVESHGLPIDIEYCKRAQKRLDKKISLIEKRIRKSKEFKKWKRHNRLKEFSVNSGDVIADLLFKYGGHKSQKETDSGKPSTDEEALASLDCEVAKDILKARKLLKAKNTYIGNFIKESVSGIMRPMFNLHVAQTYRSSSEAPNFQNIPVRDPEIKKLCRMAFVPEPGYMIGEIDYSGAEVKGAYCYHQDPNMFKYLTNPSKDMHRDTAMDCYLLEMAQMTKDIRYCGKNKFVFPEFYGDYYKNCAENLWSSIDQMDLKTADGVPLREHLHSRGIQSYLKFEKRIQKVEDIFWNKRFRVYGKWKEKQWKDYLKKGEIYLYSGFTCSGVMSRKEVTNYPVQGFAFHWLLWSFIQIHKIFKKRGFKTRILGQIHDSLVLMIWPSEINKVLRIVKNVMTKRVVQHWPVITIPLGIEVELAPVDMPWYYKKEVTHYPSCTCGNEWLYMKDVKDEDGNSLYTVAECPVCRGVRK